MGYPQVLRALESLHFVDVGSIINISEMLSSSGLDFSPEDGSSTYI
jgi:hypothetical protein